MVTQLTTSLYEAVAAAPIARRRHWLSVVSHLDPKYGGLSAAVPQLAGRLAGRAGLRITLEAFCLPGEQAHPVAYPELDTDYWPTSRKAWLLDATLRRRFRQAAAAADGVHIHGLWDQSSLIAGRAARSLGKPYIISAHGMLEPWALARGRAKKQIYATLFERAALQGAACLHALTHAEARNYREFGCTGPIAVIPNGVDIPAVLTPEPFRVAFPAVRGKRVMLFLGRLHQKKGVEMLVRAWAATGARSAGSCLVIAGPSEDETRTRAEQLVADLGLASQVLFPGMLAPAMKWSALAAAECFVLPSFSEGLSVAALEAMGAGLPVIVTENCNLPEVEHHGCGWQVRATEAELATALTIWLANAPAENQALGSRGAALVRKRYRWTAVAEQMAELYAWVEAGSKRGAAPSSFELEPAGGAA